MRHAIDCRRFLIFTLAIAAIAMTTDTFAEAPRVPPRTFTYKKVGDLEIQADVYRPDDDVVRPVALWIHGGALIMGNRQGVSRRVLNALLDDGYAVVSIDYRLAPETPLAEIVADVEDAYDWVRTEGPRRFGVKTGRIAVLGGSAGGYPPLTAGFRVRPRPTVLVAFWGYGDLVGDWYSRPSAFYRKSPLVSKADAWDGVGGAPVTDGSLRRDDRREFYLYCRQQGLWPKLVSRFDPHSEAARFDPFMPVRNVDPQYPPTLLIHGTVDTDVPYEQSVLMAKQFERLGVEHKFITVPDAGHGLSGGDRKLIDAAYAKVLPFVNRFMKPDSDDSGE